MKKIKLFTHTDLDGVGCAIVAKIAYDNYLGLDISYVNYDEVDNEVEKWLEDTTEYSHCYITDISVSDRIAKRLDELKNVEVKLFDHHPTALELNKYNWCKVEINNIFGIKTCGTEMLWEYCYDTEKFNILRPHAFDNLKVFVDAVRDWDTWRWTTTEDGVFSKEVNDLLYLYGRDDFVYKCIKTIFLQLSLEKYLDKGFRYNFITQTDTILLQIKQKQIDNYIDTKENEMRITTITDNNIKYKFGVIFADKYVSEMGNKISERHPELDFIAMIDMGNQKVSYRTTKENIDLGKDVASKFGGGGHPKAAGSNFSFDSVARFMSDLFK